MKISITPRKLSDQGGVVCMPLFINAPQGHKDWTLTTCPKCGKKCWKAPDVDFLMEHQGVTAMCTYCALKEGSKR